MDELTPQQAYDAWTAGEAIILDVREEFEHDETNVPGVPLIPMSEFMGRIDEVPEGQLVIMCRSGARSAQVANYLNGLGTYGSAANLEGGIIAWAAGGLPFEGAPPR